jgi:hypothetical protein
MDGEGEVRKLHLHPFSEKRKRNAKKAKGYGNNRKKNQR